MKASELTKGKKVWAWYLSRYLYYRQQNQITKKYIFEDIADCRFEFTEEQLEALRVEA